MKKTISLFIFSFLIVFFLNGCNSINAHQNIFESKGSYIGDNSAVGSIVKQLADGEYLKSFELNTGEEPYGITLTYEGIEAEELERQYKETAIFNAAFIFALIQNAEWVTFKFENQEYQFTKENLESWFGANLSNYSSEEDLRKLIQNHLEDDNKVEDLLK